MQFEIKVVEQDGEKLFEYNEGNQTFLFNKVAAFDEFIGGKITIKREDQSIREGSVGIRLYRGCIKAFQGLPYLSFQNLSDLTDDGSLMGRLTAQNLNEGDVLSFDLLSTNQHGMKIGTFLDILTNEFRISEAKRLVKEKEKTETVSIKDWYAIQRPAYTAPLPPIARFQ